MKKIKCIMLVAIITTAIAGYAQVSNKEEMIRKIFTVFKNKDESGFVGLFPDAATMKIFLMDLMKNDRPDGDTSAAMMDMFMEKISDSSLQREFRGNFRKNIREGENAGVEWAKASFVSYAADSTMDEEEGIKMGKLTGKIYFNVDKKEFFLEFNEVIWFANKGWYGVEVERIDEKSREHETRLLEERWEGVKDSLAIMADSLAGIAVDSVAKENIPEKKPAPKPKSKQPVKAKSTTPVRKQE